MKKLLKLISTFFVGIFAVCLASCDFIKKTPTPETPEVTPTPTPETPEVTPTPTPEKSIDLSKYDLITIEKAIEIAKAAGATATTERYYIYGTVKSIDNEQYGQMTITNGTTDLMVYGTYDKDGVKRYSELTDKPVAGAEIVLYANLCTYNDTPEVKAGWIQEFINKKQETPEVNLPTAGTEITIAQAIQIATAAGDTATTDRWIIKATVKTVSNPTYGEMTITDGKDELYVYGSYDKDGVKRYSELTDKPVAGDSITLSVNLSLFNGTPQVKAGWIQEFTHNAPDINPADYPVATLDEARDAVAGTKVKITGTVAIITYANGYIPDGVILVDDETSIYVYGKDVAGQVAVGNKISVYGTKEYFVAENEKTHATTFGYKGACQISNAYLESNDKKVNTIDLSFAQEISVKDLMDTEYSENITSLVYKTNALVKKDEQKGYTNYYINDLDGITGSYVYTKCNGGDFTWLDEFDGKICTVYFTALNAKSQTTGCNWRLQPVKVSYDNYQFNEANAAEFVIKYYALDQFDVKYTVDPEIEVVTTADIAAVNITGVTLTYASNNTDVVYFETVEGKTIMHTKDLGTAEVTITSTYKTFTANKKVTIAVADAPKYDAVTVAQAIAAEEDSVVTVKGIVTNGQQNKNAAFFLSDETGIVAVEFANGADLALVKVGNEVVIKGTRTHTLNNGAKTPQVIINKAELVVNNYGTHAHSTATFETVTFDDLTAIIADSSKVNTHQGYIVTGKVIKTGNKYYTNYNLGKDSSNIIQFYGGSGDQFKWLLEDYVDQEVTMEVVLCNWNGKGYKLTIVALLTENGKVVNDYNLK